MERGGFTKFMNDMDTMSDAQLTIIWAYVRDLKSMRAQERAMSRRQAENAPATVTTMQKAADRTSPQ